MDGIRIFIVYDRIRIHLIKLKVGSGFSRMSDPIPVQIQPDPQPCFPRFPDFVPATCLFADFLLITEQSPPIIVNLRKASSCTQ